MRFHKTTRFAEAQTAQTKAEQTANDSDLQMEDPTWLALSELDYAAIDRLLLETPAITPTEVAAKIALYERREMQGWSQGDAYSTAIQSDLAAMQGWPCSPEMLTAWRAWRDHDERYHLAVSDEDSDALDAERDQIFRAIQECPCTTPGDFILKQYLRLASTMGGTLHGPSKEDGTGNPWDIDIDADIYGGTFDEIEHPACYRDIDATDVGANLLAYGQPFFDPAAWMERADAIGLRVDLVQQQDGSWMFGQCMDLTDDENRGNNPRIRREKDRLQRIIANDYGGERRVSLLAEEIRREWPQLVRPLPAEVLS